MHDQKYQKSYKRAFPSLIYLFPRARVSRASHAWQVRAANDKAKIGGFALSTASSIPRVRTYHTKKPSRFVHALSARPLKVHGGRGSDTYADGIKSVFFIFDVCGTPTLSCRGEHCSPAKISIKLLFFSSRFCMTKSAAKVSKEDSRRPPCKPPRRARVSRASHAWQVRAAR